MFSIYLKDCKLCFVSLAFICDIASIIKLRKFGEYPTDLRHNRCFDLVPQLNESLAELLELLLLLVDGL